MELDRGDRDAGAIAGRRGRGGVKGRAADGISALPGTSAKIVW